MRMYSPCEEHNVPLFDITNTAFSMAPFSQIHFCDNGWYDVLVKETRGSETRTLTNGENYSGHSIPMYTGYTACPIAAMSTTPPVRAGAPRITFSLNTVTSRDAPEALRHMPWSRCMVFDARGAVVGTITRGQNNAGLSPRPDRLEGPEAIQFLKIVR